MKLSEQWLREWVNPPISLEQLAHQLTMAGLEVEALEPVVPEHSGVVVGEIITAEKHPDADKLQVCQVNVGKQADAPLQIVCGAANARPGIKVACAMIKAVLPGNFKIKKSRLRGVQSFGMLCSQSELGLAEQSDGIMELPQDAPVGVSLYDYYQWHDTVLEIGLTPNRGDCLSIQGIAREVRVICDTPITEPQIPVIEAQIPDQMTVHLDAPDFCPQYISRVICGVDIKRPTPLWMVEKLRRCGVRSINLIVDITNFVMLELGQPMHAFDQQKIAGEIHVRMAKAEESLCLLDQQTIRLNDNTLVIADAHKPLALAGIMGGMDSAVSDKTTNIVLESAFFVPQKIAGKARQYGLHTESSHRFERGVALSLQQQAIDRASALIIELAGGKAGPVVSARNTDFLPPMGTEQAAISFDPKMVNQILGTDLPIDQIAAILHKLNMQIDQSHKIWRVTAPDYRFDMVYGVDLVEEVARIHGYDQLPQAPLGGINHLPQVPDDQITFNAITTMLQTLGYQQVINYSFVDPEIQKWIEPDKKAIDLSNPICADLSQMRSSLWTGLCKSLLYNQNRQQTRIRLWESGVNFYYDDSGNMIQKEALGAIVSGSCFMEQWGYQGLSCDKDRSVDFYDLKADVQALMALGSQCEHFDFIQAQHPALHPGQSARIDKNGVAVGWIGALHPALRKRLGMKQNTFVFELELKALTTAKVPVYKNLSKYPAIRRDIAIIVAQSVEAASIIHTISQSGVAYLTDVFVFDVYSGSGVAPGYKSLAIALILQDNNKTLLDDDVDQVVAQLLHLLQQRHQASLRD